LKAFLLLLVFTAAGLAGVLYWRQSVLAPSAPVTASASEPTKQGKQRRRRGARRLARNEVFPASVPRGEARTGEGTSPVSAPPPEDPPPLVPGGLAATEAPPADVFGAMSSPSPAPSDVRRQRVDEPEPVKLRAADLKIIWQGEDLSRPDVVRLDFSKDDGRELSHEEIDAAFRNKEEAVLRCVARARPDEYTFVPGRVTVRFRIQRTGAVNGVQVEAPVILHKGGLTACIKGVVGGLRFPASNMSQVITYPFSLL
jgi:hypothetical protein